MKVLAFLSACLCLSPIVAADTFLLEFTAKWCPPCREMEPAVAGLEREGYRVERVDVDDPQNRNRMAEFRVQNIPTFVAITNGVESGRRVGATPIEGLRRLLGPPPRSKVSSPPTTTAPKPGDDKTQVGNLIARSVRLVVEDPQTRAFGTGTVVRSVVGETLILTCAHLFEGISPHTKTTVEFFGSPTRDKLPGELVGRDRAGDVALVRVITREVLPAAPVASRSFALAPGQSVSSVGCDHGQEPSVRTSKITAVNRYLGAATIECTGQPVQGRSGGGLFNQAGELIGVCSAAEPREQKGIYGGLTAVQSLLDRQGLASLFDKRRPLREAVLARGTSTETPLVLPPPDQLGLDVGRGLPTMNNVGDAEIVCVIRPVGGSAAPARVVVLSRASPELLAQLEKEQSAEGGTRANTAMRVRTDLSAHGWRPARKVAAKNPEPPAAARGAIQEAARWERDWQPGAKSADSLGTK